jgi:hypothetical protein
MKPAPFDYIAATSVDMAAAALADGGDDAKIIAGGQSLVPLLNFRLLRPSILIDINRIEGLAFISETATDIRVGALTRHYQLETSPVIARHLPVLSCAMTHVAHLAIRNRGTIGGSLAHGDPAAELPGRSPPHASRRRATFSSTLSPSTSTLARLSPRSRCRNCRRRPAGVLPRSRAAAAISRSPPPRPRWPWPRARSSKPASP